VDAFSVTEVGVVNSTTETIISAVDLKYFPNPFSHQINISLDSKTPFQRGILDIFNAQGQKIESQQFTQPQELLTTGSEWVPGIYFLRLSLDGKVLAESKVIKS
jgi:hypothetical protein